MSVIQETNSEKSSIEIIIDNNESVHHSTSQFSNININKDDPISIAIDGFGLINNPISDKKEIVRRYTFYNNITGMSVEVISYGAIVRSIKVPNKYGISEDVLFGFDNITGYINNEQFNIGCVIGKIYNNHELTKLSQGNDNDNGVLISESKIHLIKSGINGLDKFNWIGNLEGTVLTLSHVSENFNEKYTETIMINAIFELKIDNTFHVTFNARTCTPLSINLINNLYFNLAGHGSGFKQLYKHIITLNADKCITNENNTKSQCIGGTILDLRIPHELGPAISRCPNGGYANNYCVTKGTNQKLSFISRIIHPDSGRCLEIYSNQYNVYFYTANDFPDPFDEINPNEVYTQDFYEMPGTYRLKVNSEPETITEQKIIDNFQYRLEDVNKTKKKSNESVCICNSESLCSCTDTIICSCSDIDEPIIGKQGANYLRHGGFSMITQNNVNSSRIDKANCLNTIVKPGDTYKHEIVYKFQTIIGIKRNKESAVFDDMVNETNFNQNKEAEEEEDKLEEGIA